MTNPPTRVEELGSEWFQIIDSTPSGPSGTPPTKRLDWTNLFAPAQGPDEIGRLAHYRILRPLGAGGMGLVFLAEDTHLQRHVAIKIVRPDTAEADSRSRILQEARALASIRNDHVVTIHHVGEENDLLFLAMEFLPGESLATWMQQHPRPSLKEILQIGRDTALGLAAAHALHLVHRDIKPGNLWLEPRSTLTPSPGDSIKSATAPPFRVKVLDFGLVKKAQESLKHTRPGSVVGTPHYIAPEQAQGAKPDVASDLYSFGVVLYRLATGRLPFPQEDLFSLMSALATKPPPHVRELAADLPPALADLIMRLLAKDPAERPQSALEVVEALDAIARGETPAAAVPIAPPPARRSPVPAWVWIAVLGSGVVGVWLVLRFLFPGPHENTTESALLIPSPPAEVMKPPSPQVPVMEVMGRKDHPVLLREASALIKSMRHPGIFWTLNDHRNPPLLYAIEGSGKLRAIVKVEGAENDDWESLTSDGAGNIYIGDTGNNDHKRLQGCIYRIREPDLPAEPPRNGNVSGSVPVEATYHYSYPDRPFDCEAIFYRAGEICLVNLNRDRSRPKPLVLFRLPLDKPGAVTPLEPVCRLPDFLGEVRDAALSADGRRLALCNYRQVALYEVNPEAPLASLAGTMPRLFPYPNAISRRFEGCAWDGDALILIAEQTTEIFRMTFPAP